MASKFSQKDSEVVQDLLCDEDLRLFLTELSHVCYASRHFKFMPKDVACQLLENRASEELGTLMNGIAKNFRKAFNAIIAEHPEFLPLLERNQTIYIPYRTKREVDRYLDDGTVSLYSVSDLAKAFLECEKTILRSVYYHFEEIIRLNDGFEVKMNENMKNLGGGLSRQLKNMFGFNGEKKFFKTHNSVFTLRKVEGMNYVMLVPGVDIENYIDSLEDLQARDKGAEIREVACESGDLQDRDKGAVQYFVAEIRKVARDSGVIFIDEFDEIVDLAPEKLINEITSKHTDLSSFFETYSAIFQPIQSLSNSKNLILIGYYIPCDATIDRILDQGSKSNVTNCGIPPGEAKILHKRVKRTIYLEIQCLQSAYDQMFNKANLYHGKFCLRDFQNYLKYTAMDSERNFIRSIGAEEFLKIHSKIFPLHSVHMYSLVSESEFKNYISEINYKARVIFSDEISKLKESETKPLNPSEVSNTVDLQNVETENVKYFVSEIRKVVRDSGVIFLKEFNEIVDLAPEKLIDEITSKHTDLSSFFQTYSAIFQPIQSLSNSKNLILIGYYIPSDTKINKILDQGSKSDVSDCGITPREAKILHKHVKRTIYREIKCLRNVYDHMFNIAVLYHGKFSLRDFENYIKNTARISERNILSIGAEEFLKIHSKIFPLHSVHLYSLVSESEFKNYISEINYKARVIFSDEITKLKESVQETKPLKSSEISKTVDLQNVETENVKYFASEIRKVARDSGVIFIDEFNEIIDWAPEKLINEITSKHTDLSSFFETYSAIFQPIHSLSNQKNLIVIGYYIPSDGKIREILNNGMVSESSVTDCGISPGDVRILHNHVKRNILLEKDCLEHLYEHMSTVAVAYGNFSTSEFQDYLDNSANDSERNFILKIGVEEFLKIHSKYFPPQSIGLYSLVSKSEFKNYMTEMKYKARKIFSDEIKKLTEPVEGTEVVANNLKSSGNVDIVAIRYLAFQIHKIAGETGIIFTEELRKVINEVPEMLKFEIISKYGDFSNFISEYLSIFQPILGSSIQSSTFDTIAYCLASDVSITEILSLDSSNLSKSDINCVALSEETKILHTGVLRLTKCLEHIYQRMLPKTDSVFTLVQFQKYIDTRASKNEKKLVRDQGYEEFLKSHSIIFPVNFNGQNYYGRVTQDKFDSCITELMYYVRKIIKDEVKKLNENQLSIDNQLTFNEYIYEDQNEGYVEFIANVLNNMPHPELNFLTSLQTAIGPCHRKVQTDSTGLVSSVYLYHLT